VITLQNRFLALWARAGPDGLVTIDGAFVSQLWGQPPIYRVLTLVVEVTDDMPEEPHVFVVEVTFDADGEQIAHLDGSFTIHGPQATSLLVSVPLNLRREGRYSLALRIDGEQRVVLPLSVEFKLG